MNRMNFHIYRFGGGIEQPGSIIVFDFQDCAGIEICSDQSDPAVIVDCAMRTLRVVAGDHGLASFSVIGRADRAVPGSHAPSLRVYVDGVLFGTIPIAAVDEDGHGLGAPDNSLWQTDYFSGQYWERSDFNGDGVLGAADLSLWTSFFFGNGSMQSCAGSACP
jgi:hypothetical protein